MVSTKKRSKKIGHKTFYFSFWHGCEKHFPCGYKMNTVRMMTFGDIREETKGMMLTSVGTLMCENWLSCTNANGTSEKNPTPAFQSTSVRYRSESAYSHESFCLEVELKSSPCTKRLHNPAGGWPLTLFHCILQ